MVIFNKDSYDNDDNSEYEHVKFISYDGKYPNLCSGRLVLEIDGERIAFSNDYSKKTFKDYEPFWESGGCCCRGNNYTPSHDEWKIIYDDIPDKFKKYVYEIDEVFNENVDYGCCGGCA